MKETTASPIQLPEPRFSEADFDFDKQPVVMLDDEECLFLEGDVGDRYCYLILQGALDVRLIDADGHETWLYRLGEGELVGEMALFDDGRRSATVIAVGPTRLLRIGLEAMRQAMRRPDFLLRLASHFFTRYTHSHDVIRRLSPPKVSARIVRYLLCLPEWNDARDGRVRVRIPSQAALACLLGCQRESVTRAFRELRERGATPRPDADGALLLERERLESFLAGV